MIRRILITVLLSMALVGLLSAGSYTNVLAARNKAIPVFQHSFDISAQHMYAPGAIAVDGNGNIYLTDNSPDKPCVVKFDKHGKFVKQWGSLGSEPGQFIFWPTPIDAGPSARVSDR